ncbi:WAS/WASL-interacting protein family member 3-like [Bufo gargarizans]|uniref:WAS/WASL-interacting protein family member 3-like n=1 Tax=Bufo gargarizans TaxID=30331 RepID=UPI001CF4C3D9|nr:WAS/WASL-interacting protein family member 3-like [Bufo gargarizans]
MEELLRQLIVRAESAGGEEWLRTCLLMPPSLLPPPPPPRTMSPPLLLSAEERTEPGGRGPVPEQREEEPSVAWCHEEELSALPRKRARKAKSAYTLPPPEASRRRSSRADSVASGRSRGSSLSGVSRGRSGVPVCAAGSGASRGQRHQQAPEDRHHLVPSPGLRHQKAASGNLPAQACAAKGVLQDEIGLPVERLPPPVVELSPGPSRRPPQQSAAASGPVQEDRPVGSHIVVWIVGHSFIFWAQKRAEKRIYSENLTFDSADLHVLEGWVGRVYCQKSVNYY